MRKLKSLLMVALTLICISCSMSAKSDKNEVKETAAQGEVVSLDKAAFLSKVYNFETSPNEWVYAGNKPCIIDFYADWCGPCRQIAPILKELAAEYKDQIVVYKIDTDKQKELAAAFGIQALPALLFVPLNGKPQIAQGALSKEQFKELINDFLLKSNQ